MARSSVRRASGVSASSDSAVTTACIFVSQYLGRSYRRDRWRRLEARQWAMQE
jgi:hypothetical protein